MKTQQGRAIIFRNCRQFIPAEVEILRPDLIVTQGKWAREALLSVFPVMLEEASPSNARYLYRVVRVRGHETMMINTAHPSPRARRYFRPEKETAYPWYVAQAHRFLAAAAEAPSTR